MLEVKAAVVGIERCFRECGRRVPLQVQVTLDTSGRMLLGTDIGAVLATLEALPVDVVGLNCSTGPEHMREPVRYLTSNSRLPISVIPNAGLPKNVGGRAVYPMEPAPFAAELREFVVGLGVNAVGGCCGTTPSTSGCSSRRSAVGRRRLGRSWRPRCSRARSVQCRCGRSRDPSSSASG